MREVADSAVPLRPSLPCLLAVALSMWCAAAVAYSLGQSCAGEGLALVALASGALVLVLVMVLWKHGAHLVLGALTGIALGCCCGCAHAASLHADMEKAKSEPAGTWLFTLEEDASLSAYGSQGFARAVSPSGDSLLVRVLFNDDAERLYGDTFTARASLSFPEGTQASYCWQHGAPAVAHIGDVRPVEREGAVKALLALRYAAICALSKVGGDEASVLQALVCGARTSLAQSTLYGDFKAAGLAHMVAVSGAHLVIVSGFTALVLRTLRAPKPLAVVLQAAFVFLYLVFSAVPVSAVRAAVMSVVGMASYAAQRRPAPLNALAVCIMALIVASPEASVSVSFALSAGSTLGIVLLSGLVSSWLEGGALPLPRFVRDALALTLASSVATMPASAALFTQASLVAPVSNVVCAPLFAVVCTGGLVAALGSLAVPAAAPFLMAAAGTFAHVLNGIVRTCASAPFACVPVNAPVVPMIALSVTATGALWWFWPQVRTAALAAIGGVCAAVFAVWALGAPYAAGSEIVMLDVGQGDALLVRSEGHAVLIDTGNRSQLLREALARHGVWRLDAVVVTHADDDHCGSLASLRGVVGLDSALVVADALECPCASCEKLRESIEVVAGRDGAVGLKVGDTVRCGAISLRVVWPYKFTCEGGNADSLCLLASYDPEADGIANWTAFFCGDAEAAQIHAIEDAGLATNVDIYKVGHHGSRAALDAACARALSPSIALLSVGANNRYGHPAPETIACLESAGAEVFRTDEQGDVSCKLEPDRLRVTTLR